MWLNSGYWSCLLLLTGWAFLPAQAHFCALGCTLVLDPVCAKDGRSYMNSCIAGCAGNNVTTTGYCKGHTWRFYQSLLAAGASTARQAAPPTVSAAVMQKFQKDGYVYLGRVALAQTVLKEGNNKQQKVAPAMNEAAAVGGFVDVLRATPPGDFYSARLAYNPSSRWEYAPFNPKPPPQKATTPTRKLHTVIGGSDERILCKRGVWPFSPVAQLSVRDSTGQLVCSGALVGPDRLLTAAHCVWNTFERTFAANLDAAPGRYNAGRAFVDPYGTIEWSYVTIFKAYADSGVLQDIAVVRLQTPIGQKVGWLGARAPCNSGGNGNAAVSAIPLTAAGYPLIAPVRYGGGTYTGACYTQTCSTRFDCSADLTFHTCDTSPGQSGGPLWDSLGYVRGVHIRGGADASAPYNQATTLTKFMLDNVMTW